MCPVEYRPDGALTLLAGASRTGKSLETLARTRGASRLLVWDPEGQWCALGHAQAITLAELIERTRTDPRGRGRWAYVAPPSAREFDRFCRLAWAWVRLACTTVVVEELADVTHPGKAPDAWGVLLRRGLKYGAHLLATTQAPAESDKTIIRNAGVVVCFRQERAGDRSYMARELDAPLEMIESLQVLEYLEKRRGQPLLRGRVRVPKLRTRAARTRA